MFSNLLKYYIVDKHFESPYSIISTLFLSCLSIIALFIIALFIIAEVRFEEWRETRGQKNCNCCLSGTPGPF